MIVVHKYIAPKRGRGGMKAARAMAMGKALAHVKYIQHRPGEDREKGGREFFGETDDELQAKRVRKAVREMRDSKVTIHKLTLSPEINGYDKKALTRHVMKQLGNDIGRELDWVAVAHENTEHEHIHVVVLGKDKKGRDVKITRDDHSKARAFGDKFLEREHPLEMERSRRLREEKQKDRLSERTRERKERVQRGVELPFLKQKIIREISDPYEQWRKRPPEIPRPKKSDRKEKPAFGETIEYGDYVYSKENSLEELAALNEYLWEVPYDDRLNRKDYEKLTTWLHEKEDQRDGVISDKQVADKQRREPKAVEKVTYNGQVYDKDSTAQEFQDLKKQLREKDAKRLPTNQFNQIQYWSEDKDRAKYTNIIQQEMGKALEREKKELIRAGQALELEGGRFTDPVLAETMAIPGVNLWFKFAGMANTLVKLIPLTENRDRLKEGRDDLETAKLDKVQEHNKAGRPEEQKANDRETIEKLDKAIDHNQEARDEVNKEKKRKKIERENEEDPFLYDPWGRY